MLHSSLCHCRVKLVQCRRLPQGKVLVSCCLLLCCWVIISECPATSLIKLMSCPKEYRNTWEGPHQYASLLPVSLQGEAGALPAPAPRQGPRQLLSAVMLLGDMCPAVFPPTHLGGSSRICFTMPHSALFYCRVKPVHCRPLHLGKVLASCCLLLWRWVTCALRSGPHQAAARQRQQQQKPLQQQADLSLVSVLAAMCCLAAHC
jgi:hypothetical protein